MPLVLVGTKSDLRDDQDACRALEAKGLSLVPLGDCTNRCQELGAKAYYECSALTQDGLKDVFDGAIQAAMAPKDVKKKNGCLIL